MVKFLLMIIVGTSVSSLCSMHQNSTPSPNLNKVQTSGRYPQDLLNNYDKKDETEKKKRKREEYCLKLVSFPLSKRFKANL